MSEKISGMNKRILKFKFCLKKVIEHGNAMLYSMV